MPARRVISLCPSITETLVEIGGRAVLVAATRYCTRPRGILRGIERIGGTKDPDIGAILALTPDLVFANQEENRLEDVEALRSAGVEVHVTFPKRVADVPRDIREWGASLGGSCESEAEALSDRVSREVALLEEATAPPQFRYAYWIWRDPWMTISDDTYVADLLRLAGGVNAYGAEADRYPATTPEEALARGAGVHFLPDEPYPFRERRHAKLAEELFGAVCRRLFVPGDDFCWHGYRTLAGLEWVRRLRSGSAFGS
ncbi:MAG TPA: helical backbone metal receptor [Thermoanaerobaculia bacterium]|nr:helical backbone metal receptor [Thermoanaerobaculia bacterium]